MSKLCASTQPRQTQAIIEELVFLWEKIGRHLLYYVCRHHLLELVLQATFPASLGSQSTGLEILLFKRFRDHWTCIDQQQLQTADTNTLTKATIAKHITELIEFVKSQALQVRDDYQELLSLSVIFLVGVLY